MLRLHHVDQFDFNSVVPSIDVALQRAGCPQASPPGRPKKLSDEQALKAAKLFAKGYKQLGTGLTLHFTSTRHATSKSPELHKICKEAGVSPRQLFDRMRQAMPTLKKRSMTFIQPLDQKLKEERVRLLRQNCSYFDRIIWIDAAKSCISLDKHQGVWVNVEWHNKLITEDRRAPGKRGQKICLAYYAAVNHVLGPVWIGLTTGTKGCKKTALKTYRVSLKLF